MTLWKKGELWNRFGIVMRRGITVLFVHGKDRGVFYSQSLCFEHWRGPDRTELRGFSKSLTTTDWPMECDLTIKEMSEIRQLPTKPPAHVSLISGWLLWVGSTLAKHPTSYIAGGRTKYLPIPRILTTISTPPNPSELRQKLRSQHSLNMRYLAIFHSANNTA